MSKTLFKLKQIGFKDYRVDSILENELIFSKIKAEGIQKALTELLIYLYSAETSHLLNEVLLYKVTRVLGLTYTLGIYLSSQRNRRKCEFL